ncbi:MAG: G-D-S-L family lipolytic protein, partial [Flavobacteriaceae bacterium]|nr:G-D-S-L family lipolytic protein [Flavobacteriaceae bacterium]
AGGAKGAVVTVPSIVNLPYFTTVPHNAIPLDEATANQLNAGYALYNGSLLPAITGANALWSLGLTPEQIAAEVVKRTISFSAGQNAAVIIDEDLTNLTGINPQLVSMRQATADDFLVLTSSSFLGTTVGGNPALINGVTVPLADNWVLTPEEQNNIQTAVDAYNATIVSVGSANGLAVVDLNQLLNDAAAGGAQFDNFTMTTSLVFGGLVSLDGVHLTSRGYALMGNKILEAIDATYGSNFKASGNLAKAANYPTNYPPGI